MPVIKVESFTFEKPVWAPDTKTVPGAEVKLSVAADKLQQGQKVVFEVHDEQGLLATIEPVKNGKAYEHDKWKVPNTFAAGKKLHFYAMLREEPSAANDHVTVRKRLKSAELEVDGFAVKIDSIDAAFVPGRENLEVKLTVTDPSNAVKKARIEVWGEKYPSNKPLYAETKDVVAGQTTWNSWDGTANDGHLTTTPSALITPEFTPYRVRVITGPDAESVEHADDPTKGKGRVAICEAQFEVTFQSLLVRLAAHLEVAVTTALDRALAIEPRNANGTYPAMGRLPTAAPWTVETARIRIDNMRHNAQADTLNQGHNGAQHRIVVDPYIHGGANSKYQIDNPVYVRPEIPIEVEAHLQSRTANDNTNAPFGHFRAGAVGPLKLDLHVEDVYKRTLYTNLGANRHDNYAFQAAHLVKDGTHGAPVSPLQITYWQHREEIGVVAPNAQVPVIVVYPYTRGNGELTVYLNRTKLDLAAGDYAETNNPRITLAAGLARQHDVVWVMRVPVAAAPTVAVARWPSFPPGDNCHEHYGGIRGAAAAGGESRSKLLRDRFTATAGALGYGTVAFPYTAHINLDPDNAVGNAERVESKAEIANGNQQGLAGIVFSPSVIGGDSYAIEATAFACPYDRSLGFVANRSKPAEAGARAPWRNGRTGTLTMWRLCTLVDSQKLPDLGTIGLTPGVGFTDTVVRVDPGDGNAMNVGRLNTLMDRAFTEWTLPVPLLPTRVNDPHQDANLVTYRGSHNALLPGPGMRNLGTNAAVTNDFVQWDHYRLRIPPNVPANRLQLVSNVIAAQPAGTPAATVAGAASHENGVYNRTPVLAWPFVGAGKADQALRGGVAAIAQHPGTPAQHQSWLKGIVLQIAGFHLDALTPRVIPPTQMCAVRWPALYQDHWSDAWTTDSIGVAGYCRGDGQSFFATAPDAGNPDTFEHEMGHSLHLAHFITFSATNSCWKHHDHAYPSCIMGYYDAPGLGLQYTVPGSGGGGAAAIQLNTGNRALFCPKCLQKLRGWNEEVLPCNWTHRNVF